MSESHDREVLVLLDRAAADVPPLHLAREDVVARGKQIVRRRRATTAGTGIAGLALAGTVWLGLGGSGILGTTQVSPAGTDWEAPGGVSLTVSEEGWPEVVLTKEGPDGFGSVTIGTGPDAETVPGELVAGDLVQYQGSEVTVAVWAVPEGTDGRLVVDPPAAGDGDEAVVGWPAEGVPVDVEGARLDFALSPSGTVMLDAVTEVPRLGGSTIAAASGAEVVTGRLEDKGYGTEIFVLPSSGVWGEVEEEQLVYAAGVHHATLRRPWWQGAGAIHVAITRVDDAVRVRGAASQAGYPDRLLAVAPGTLDELQGHRFGIVPLGGEPPGLRGPSSHFGWTLGLEWADGSGVWHRQDLDASPSRWVPREAVAGDDVGPGEELTLLGKDYTVAVDPHGWPQLLDSADGSVLLRVPEDDGTLPAGGLIDMTRWSWPWQANEWIHFSVDAQDSSGAAPHEVIERATMVGPEGKVVLTSYAQ